MNELLLKSVVLKRLIIVGRENEPIAKAARANTPNVNGEGFVPDRWNDENVDATQDVG